MWIWALLAAARGGRGGLIAATIFNLLLAFGWGLATLAFWCPSPCGTIWPLMEIAIWANLVVGLLAAVPPGFQLKSSPPLTRSAERDVTRAADTSA